MQPLSIDFLKDIKTPIFFFQIFEDLHKMSSDLSDLLNKTDDASLEQIFLQTGMYRII